MRKNIFKDFVWDKNGNGEYFVTCLLNGMELIAIPRLGEKGMYCIKNCKETEKNFFDQDIPKRFTKFEIMDILKNAIGNEEYLI